MLIEHKVVLQPDEVGVRLEPGAGDIGDHAAKELKTLFATKAGVEAAGSGFEIVIGLARGTEAGRDVSEEERRRLRSLPNRDQAYLIKPVGENRLVLAALEPRGLYYAVRTLHQLLEPSHFRLKPSRFRWRRSRTGRTSKSAAYGISPSPRSGCRGWLR